jgi:hypothetical protein
MGTAVSIGRRVWTGIGALLLSACAGMGPGALTSGVSTGPEVEARLGQPAKTWQNADGSRQLAFVSGPGGTQTFMAFIGPDGKLTRLVGVLNEYYFNLIRPGATQDEVLGLLGPASAPAMTYKRTDTLTWSWLYCQSQNVQQYFDVNFDVATGLVRNTGQHQWTHGYMPGTPPCVMQNIDLP